MKNFDSGVWVYITSWARYNEGGSGGWYCLNGKTWEDLKEELTKDGFKINGYDEELTIHDYNDNEGLGLHELFGEAYPSEVLNFIEKWDELTEHEQTLFKAIKEAYSNEEALQALNNNDFDDFDLYDDDDYDDYIMECLQVPDHLVSYIDMDYARREFGYDFSETDYGHIARR